MKKPNSLDVVRGVAESKAQTLAGEVGVLMQEKEDARQMLSRLTEYVADYSALPGQASNGTYSALSMENQHRFVSKLNSALEQQRSHAARIAERANYKLSSWQRACADLEAVDRLIARRARDEERVTERQEQREADATALRMFSAAKAGQSS